MIVNYLGALLPADVTAVSVVLLSCSSTLG